MSDRSDRSDRMMRQLVAVPATVPVLHSWTRWKVPPADNKPGTYRYLLGYRHLTGFAGYVKDVDRPVDNSAMLAALDRHLSARTHRMQVRVLHCTLLAAPISRPAQPVRAASNHAYPFRYQINFWTGTGHDIVMLDVNQPVTTVAGLAALTAQVIAHTGFPRTTVYGLQLLAAPATTE